MSSSNVASMSVAPATIGRTLTSSAATVPTKTAVATGGAKIQEVSEKVHMARSENAPSVHESAKISKESVEAAAEKIQSFVSSMSRNLNIYVDSSTGTSVIRVVDPDSAQVIRQIPPEESIRLAQTVDFLSSLLVHQRA